MFKINKKGFTLVELLAVIVVLAIIMIIAIPSVMRTMEKAKISSFKIFSQKALIKGEEKHQNDIMMGENDNINSELPISFNLYSFEDIGIKSAGKYRGCVIAVSLPPGMAGDGYGGGPFGNGSSTMIGAVISNDDYSTFGDFRMIQDITNNNNNHYHDGPRAELMPPIPENVIEQSCSMSCFDFSKTPNDDDYNSFVDELYFWDTETCPLFPEWIDSMQNSMFRLK